MITNDEWQEKTDENDTATKPVLSWHDITPDPDPDNVSMSVVYEEEEQKKKK